MVAKVLPKTPNYESCPYLIKLHFQLWEFFYFHSNYTFLLPKVFPVHDALKARPSLTLSLCLQVCHYWYTKGRLQHSHDPSSRRQISHLLFFGCNWEEQTGFIINKIPHCSYLVASVESHHHQQQHFHPFALTIHRETNKTGSCTHPTDTGICCLISHNYFGFDSLHFCATLGNKERMTRDYMM